MKPILYTAKNCPYCARTINVLNYSQTDVEIMEVDLNKLPDSLTSVKREASIPFLDLDHSNYIDESFDIMVWALNKNDPDNWLGADNEYLKEAEMLIETYDYSFMNDLKAYKESNHGEEERSDCEEYLEELDDLLEEHRYLASETLSVADIAILPHIYLFSLEEPEWFNGLEYPKFHNWLQTMLRHEHFE